jgi:uncharacterized protein (PEP-CTERM system associated)
MPAARLIVAPLTALAALALVAAAAPAAAQFSVAPVDQQDAVQDRLTEQQMQPPPELRTSLAPPAQPPTQPPAQPPAKPLPAWIIVPRIDVQEMVTDNARQSTTQRTADLVTLVSPGVFISGDTPALRTTLDYSPTLQRNVVATDQNAVYQQGFATADATLVPDRLFFDARGSAFEGSRAGADAAFSPQTLSRADRAQVLTWSAGPVAKAPVFDSGSAELRYTIGQAQFIDNTSALANGTVTPVNSISSATQQDLRASLDTGQSFGRLANHLILDAGRTDVSEAAFSSTTASFVDETQYKLWRNFSLIGSFGYQVYDFAQFSALNLSGPTGAAGFEYQPNAGSYIRLTYGHRDGVNSFQSDARYAVTPLTTAFASYVEGIATPQQAILGNLAAAAETSTGSIVNAETGLPMSLYNSQFALQNDILRFGTFTGGLIADLSPNLFTVTLTRQTIQSLTGATPNDSSIGGVIGWSRAVSPLTTVAASVAYFHHELDNEASYDASLSVAHSFTETLFGNLRYEFAKLDSEEAGRSFYQNAMTVSMRKLF